MTIMDAIEAGYRKYARKRAPLPLEEEVAALEHRIGITLPEHFRRFVLDYNGGWFNSPAIEPDSPNCPVDALDVLYGIGASHPSAELASPADIALFDDNDPLQVLPIGYTVMGNLLILLTHPEPEDRGVVMLKRAYSDDYFLMGRTMDEFFARLRDPF
jgi:hypothetical protein